MKKFKLLKDLPDIKAGAIFEIGSDKQWYPITDRTGETYTCHKYKSPIVENNPEWFREVKEEKKESDDTLFRCLKIAYSGIVCTFVLAPFGDKTTADELDFVFDMIKGKLFPSDIKNAMHNKDIVEDGEYNLQYEYQMVQNCECPNCGTKLSYPITQI